jgi:hypothetical protein
MSKFRLLPVAHSVQRLRVDLASIGKSATTYDQTLLPETWVDAIGLEVGNEIEIIGSSFTRMVRVTSLGPAGPTLAHISGEQSAPVTRHLFVPSTCTG